MNGKSQGRRRKNLEASKVICNPNNDKKDTETIDRYRLRWNDVIYEPGELRVVAYDNNGMKADEKTIHTAGKPYKLILSADRETIKADGNDLAYVTVSVVDKNGNVVPNASDQLSFNVSGAGIFKGVCNGDATSLEPFTKPTMKLFSGKLVVVDAEPVELGICQDVDGGEAILVKVELLDGECLKAGKVTVHKAAL